jgi:hypothetical protein
MVSLHRLSSRFGVVMVKLAIIVAGLVVFVVDIEATSRGSRSPESVSSTEAASPMLGDRSPAADESLSHRDQRAKDGEPEVKADGKLKLSLKSAPSLWPFAAAHQPTLETWIGRHDPGWTYRRFIEIIGLLFG